MRFIEAQVSEHGNIEAVAGIYGTTPGVLYAWEDGGGHGRLSEMRQDFAEFAVGCEWNEKNRNAVDTTRRFIDDYAAVISRLDAACVDGGF